MSKPKRVFTREEVAEGDGREGRPVYIVFENTVYDVSESPLWKNGSHMQMHQAGADLTDQLAAAPHFAEVFTKKRVKEVGVLKPDQRSKDLPGFMKTLLRSLPMLRRHPHPISVHFPTAYLTTAFLFLLVHYVIGESVGLDFHAFAFIMVVLGVVSAVFAMGTGFLTLWVNYRMKIPPLVQWKIKLAISVLGTGLLAIILFATGLVELAFFRWIYNLLLLVLALLVMGLGYLGGQMVFPTKVR
ncbi:MAG: DUF2231 domain-containing protein [Desulfovermiculus sp.]|nr:DUF2231 domain-containing protein [Desulfovermiculus sp.]